MSSRKRARNTEANNLGLTEDEYNNMMTSLSTMQKESVKVMMSNSHVPDYAFKHCFACAFKDLSGVTSVGKFAFAHSRVQLTALPDSIVRLDAGAFSDCSLLGVRGPIPPKLLHIPHLAFCNSRLVEFDSFANIVCIGARAFEHCVGLHTIETPSNLKLICEHAFHGCTYLKLDKLPNVETMCEGAFMDALV